MKNIEYNFTTVDFNPFEGPEILLTAPSTLSQQEIWTSCQLGGADASLAYNESLTLELKGALHIEFFQKALQSLITRHQTTRLTFSADGTKICVYKDAQNGLEIVDLTSFDYAQQQKRLKECQVSEVNTVFDLLDGPLFRFTLFSCNTELHYFVLTAHHIVCDGWSFGILLQDLSKLYNSYQRKTISILPVCPQYSDYAVHQWNEFGSPEHSIAEEFWIEQFHEPVIIDVPTDLARPKVRTYKSRGDDYILKPSIISNLRKLSATESCSFATVLIAAFEVFLYKLTGQKTTVLGLPSAGQPATNNYGLTGHCVSLLPLKSEINGDDSFSAYLKERKAYLLNAFEHQMITFGALLNKLNIPRDISRIPLVPVVLNIDIGLDEGVNFEGLQHRLYYSPKSFETFEIFLNISGKGDDLTLQCSYNTQIFGQENIGAMMKSFQTVLETVSINSQIKLSDILKRPQTDFVAKLNLWNGTEVEYPQVPLTELITQAALNFPGKIAVSFNDQSLTYGNLENKSNQFAHALIEAGINTGDRVGISVDRSIEMLVALLGVLKSGACYIPLDPSFPKERLQYMLEDSGAKLLVTSERYLDLIATPIKKLSIENLDTNLSSYPSSTPNVALQNNSAAYILYTSGSTGKPKGVEVLHYNLVNFLCSMQKEPGITSDDVLLAITTISFDIAGLELFLPLIAGAGILIANTEEVKDGRLLFPLLNRRVSILQATPSTWKMILDAGWKGNKKIKALCGGEPLSKTLADEILAQCGSLWNMYGPTETTIWSTVKQIRRDQSQIVVGRPIDNTKIYILNEQLELAPEGGTGEICIGGEGVASGYINRPELTAEKFIPDNFSDGPFRKIYRTGDLGRFTSDGELVCLGRIDHQVKIRGHRIELDEIEHQLIALPDVKDVVVVAIENTSGFKLLCAYIIPNRLIDDQPEEISKWKQALKNALPEYMIPAEMMIIEKFPLTPNGKIDRKSLPDPQIASKPGGKYNAPQTNLEKTITTIWAEVLGVEKVSVTANFFEIGGHSIIAVQVMTRIEKATGVNLPLASLFSYPSIKELAYVIESNQEAIKDSYNSLVPIKPHGSNPPLFIVHGGGLNVLLFNFIAGKMDAEQPVYGLQPKGLDGAENPLDTIEDIAAHYNNAVLSKSPDGPYLLAGYSMGGMIALEMAKQLRSAGKEVKMLAMLDTYADVSERDKSVLAKGAKKILMALPKLLFFTTNFIRFPAHTVSYRKEIVTQWFRDKFKFGPQSVVNKKLNDAFEEAFNNYKMTPYDGEIHVFKAQIANWYLPDPQCLGWKPYTKRGVKIHMVKGDHRTMLTPPLDKEFAQVMQSCINSALDISHEEIKVAS